MQCKWRWPQSIGLSNCLRCKLVTLLPLGSKSSLNHLIHGTLIWSYVAYTEALYQTTSNNSIYPRIESWIEIKLEKKYRINNTRVVRCRRGKFAPLVICHGEAGPLPWIKICYVILQTYLYLAYKRKTKNDNICFNPVSFEFNIHMWTTDAPTSLTRLQNSHCWRQ